MHACSPHRHDMEGCSDRLPFQLSALQWAMETGMQMLQQEVQQLEQRIHPLLDSLVAKVRHADACRRRSYQQVALCAHAHDMHCMQSTAHTIMFTRTLPVSIKTWCSASIHLRPGRSGIPSQIFVHSCSRRQASDKFYQHFHPAGRTPAGSLRQRHTC